MADYDNRSCFKHGETKHRLRKRTDTADVTWRWQCVACESGYKTAQRRRVKAMLVEVAGGKCVRCGYSKCLRALTFHHLDPLEKAFEISGTSDKSVVRLLEEIQKCDLLCANCHSEIEDETPRPYRLEA